MPLPERIGKPISDLQISRLAGIWRKLTILEKQNIMRLVLGSEDYVRTHATLVYTPHLKQYKFHTAPNKGRSIFGGNQSGKTWAGTYEDAFHFTGEYPDWYPQELKMPMPNYGRILVKDFPKGVGEVIEPALLRCIHPRFVKKATRNSQGHLAKMEGHNGCRIDIVTHDMDTQSLEGWQGHWIHADEPSPRDKWIACMRGLIRYAGRWWITCTPLTEPWIYDEIYTKENVFSITVDIRDNPYLTEEEIKIFEEGLTEDEIESRIHGKFMHLSGLRHKNFDSKIHIKEELPPDAVNWPTWQIIDPHNRKPFAIGYGKVDPMGRKWFFKEWPTEWFHKMKTCSKTPRDYIALFQEMELRDKIHSRIMDGRFCKQPQGTGGDCLQDIFDDLQYNFDASYITTTLGITDPGYLKIEEALRISPVTGEPDFFVLRDCKNLIWSFQHNTWENYRDDQKGVKETQSQLGKDFLDLLRYWFMENPQFFLPDHQAKYGRSKWVKDQQMIPSGYEGTYGSGDE